MIKNFFRVLLIAAVLLALAFVGLIFLVNPNQFRGAIEQAVLDATGYELNIAGDLDLRFSPYIGLTLQDVRLRNPASPQELASTSEVSLRVDPGLLLQGELLISEFRADDFHINYFTDADGNNIWNVTPASSADPQSGAGNAGGAATPDTTQPSVASTNSSIRASFERIVINNASVDIQDLRAGTGYRINRLNVDSSNANLNGAAFPVALDFVFLNNGISEPLNMALRSNVTFNQSSGELTVDAINFSLTPMLLQGQLTVTGLNNAGETPPQITGHIESNQFTIADLQQTLSPTADTTDLPGISTQPPVSFALDFNGTPEQFSVPAITVNVGSTIMQANANVRAATAFDPASISYEVISNALDLTPFMTNAEVENTSGSPAAEPVTAASTLPGATTGQATDTPLPFDLLNAVNLIGSISIESITARNMVFDDINIFTNLEDGVLDIESQPITAFDGTILGNMRLDARNGAGNLTTQLLLSQLNIANITPTVSPLNAVAGKLDVDAQYTASGATTGELMNSLNGSTQFAITENSVDIGLVKQVFTAISALSTSGEAIQQWPDIIQFVELSGYILLENGIRENQQIKVRMDNFDITGTGGLDLAAQTFDYDLLFTVLGEPFVQTIPISPTYHDISWPVQCSSSFTDSVAQYCRPDFTQVRQIFSQMGTNEVRRRLDDVVNDQVPEQLQDTARGLLRNIFNN